MLRGFVVIEVILVSKYTVHFAACDKLLGRNYSSLQKDTQPNRYLREAVAYQYNIGIRRGLTRSCRFGLDLHSNTTLVPVDLGQRADGAP